MVIAKVGEGNKAAEVLLVLIDSFMMFKHRFYIFVVLKYSLRGLMQFLRLIPLGVVSFCLPKSRWKLSTTFEHELIRFNHEKS
jgi:hypothetical protein